MAGEAGSSSSGGGESWNYLPVPWDPQVGKGHLQERLLEKHVKEPPAGAAGGPEEGAPVADAAGLPAAGTPWLFLELSWDEVSVSLGSASGAEVGMVSKSAPQQLCRILLHFLSCCYS